MFFPSDLISMNLPTLYKVIRKVEDKLDKSEKKYIEWNHFKKFDPPETLLIYYL